jgi:excisionase family DNA binding protein
MDLCQAARLRISRLTVGDWLRSGKLIGVKVGRLWRIRESDLEAFLEGGKRRKLPYPAFDHKTHVVPPPLDSEEKGEGFITCPACEHSASILGEKDGHVTCSECGFWFPVKK